MPHPLRCLAALGLAALIALAQPAQAIEDRADIDPSLAPGSGKAVAWKATYGLYRSSTEGQARDVNLRGNTTDLTFWLGSYKDAQNFEQHRIGLEYVIALPWGKLTPSFQSATGGFFGWSLTWNGQAEQAEGVAPLLGLGRTNQKTYYNLNFDPNDSVMVGASYASRDIGLLMLYRVQDDRLHTGQTTHHLVWRKSLSSERRLTVDLFKRRGAEQAGSPVYQGTGASVTVDIGDYFVRLGHDPKANYKAGDITRLAVGLKF
jgi:hypothetical protein